MSDSKTLLELLQRAVSIGASDVHLHSGAPLAVRLHGKLMLKGSAKLPPKVATNMALTLINEGQRKEFEEHAQLEFAVTVPDVARFRCSLYRQLRGVDLVMRVIRLDPPRLGELGLGDNVQSVVKYRNGLVIITGPAGSGKSSTLAGLVEQVNERRHDNIIFLEDPIEYIHTAKRCLISQRHVGRHTESYAKALRAALRQDPDVIVVGELRDAETTSLALTAAETGHLVMTTMHTAGVIPTIDRIISMFPPEEQARARMMLSNSLRACITQRLVPTADGRGRIPAFELLKVNAPIAQLIRENELIQLQSAMQLGAAEGMSTLDDSLTMLVRSGQITEDEAKKHSDSFGRTAKRGPN